MSYSKKEMCKSYFKWPMLSIRYWTEETIHFLVKHKIIIECRLQVLYTLLSRPSFLDCRDGGCMGKCNSDVPVMQVHPISLYSKGQRYMHFPQVHEASNLNIICFLQQNNTHS